jgi:hypothetical protein
LFFWNKRETFYLCSIHQIGANAEQVDTLDSVQKSSPSAAEAPETGRSRRWMLRFMTGIIAPPKQVGKHRQRMRALAKPRR